MKGDSFQALSVKDAGIFIGWIASILLLGVGLWFFTQSIRTGILLTRVNQALAFIEDPRELEHAIVTSEFPMYSGSWYTLKDSESRALVFSIMSDGIFFPCVAMVSVSGTVDEIIPLTNYSRQSFKQLPEGVIKTYIQRIERGALQQIKELNR